MDRQKQENHLEKRQDEGRGHCMTGEVKKELQLY